MYRAMLLKSVMMTMPVTGSDDSRHSNTSLAWGAGVQFNPTESVAIDIAYEGSGSGDWRTDGFIVGVGYKF